MSISSPGGDGAETAPARSKRRVNNAARRAARARVLGKEPLWYKDAAFYEVHVRAFKDSNADGIGDFPGLTQQLDYLQELGVTAVWLLPFYPSPLRDDGYDIADYLSINPIYGTLKDFKSFLAHAHTRNLRVITELVVNHTSDQHSWFQRSRRAPKGSPWRDFYVWSDTREKYREARIIFRDFEPSNWTWDPVASAYYWHRFYSHQPDLNFDNPMVHEQIRRVLDFWLDLDVDGVRLDAVPYLYEREGTSCENLPETHAFLKALRQHVDEKYEDRMLLAEANQWPEDAVSYFGAGKGDECHMAFHFPLMPRIFMAVRMEDRIPIVDILEQTPSIPETGQWALFLRNHDELTLEMVTDEERDYMYRVYADDARARINLGIRRRLAPLLGNDRKRIELLYLLLFSFPGTPVLYYGDEIGMGDNIFLGDRNGVRTPMQWSSDKNAGFSRASPQALYLPITLDPEYHYEAVNVEAQQRNPHSLFWWTKRTLTLRKRHRAFGRGTLQFLHPENRKILAFVRKYQEEAILVVANLSRFPQPVSLELSDFKDWRPIELFGRAPFPVITGAPYFLTLSPHAAFWFALEPQAATRPASGAGPRELAIVGRGWEDLFRDESRAELDNALTGFLSARPEFGGTKGDLKSVQIRDAVHLPSSSPMSFLLFLLAEFLQGEPRVFLLPVSLMPKDSMALPDKPAAQDIIAHLRIASTQQEGCLVASACTRHFCKALLEFVRRRRGCAGKQGELRSFASGGLRNGQALTALEPALQPPGANNTVAVLGDTFLLKLYSRLEAGTNPELEFGRFLTERHFPNVPPVVGSLEYRRHNGEHFELGIITQFQPNAQDGWAYTLDLLSRYFDRVRTAQTGKRLEPQASESLLGLASSEVPDNIVALIGTYLELARLLGQRTGEMHLALAADSGDQDFAPEPFTPFYQRALYQSMRNLLAENLELLRLSLAKLPEDIRADAQKVASLEEVLLKRLRALLEVRLQAQRIRCHGDFHLGQVLYTGKDFLFLDFQTEHKGSLGERRIRRSALRDVAGMIRSFDYVTHVALWKQLELGTTRQEQLANLEPWANFWCRWVSAVFLKAYLQTVGPSTLVPPDRGQLQMLLEVHLLGKALAELGFEIRNRPDWVKIPLHSLVRLLETGNMP